MDDNNNLTPEQNEEVKNFEVTENNSWDAHQPQAGPIPPQGPGNIPPQNPNMAAPSRPGMVPPQGTIPPQGPGTVPPQAAYPIKPGKNQPPALIPEMSVKDWMLTLLLGYIPIAGLILKIVWAAEHNPRPEERGRKNWAIASLIWKLIGYVISVVLYSILSAVLLGIMDYFF